MNVTAKQIDDFREWLNEREDINGDIERDEFHEVVMAWLEELETSNVGVQTVIEDFTSESEWVDGKEVAKVCVKCHTRHWSAFACSGVIA